MDVYSSNLFFFILYIGTTKECCHKLNLLKVETKLKYNIIMLDLIVINKLILNCFNYIEFHLYYINVI
jgi:hypothetical protein